MFVDRATIVIKAGNGGDGAVSFYTAIYVPNGGPDGGTGGNGGDIVFEATNSLNTLIDFKYKRFFRADNGEKGGTRNKSGQGAKPLVIKVPCGTVIKDAATGNVVADLHYHGQTVVVQKGGRGGLGNARFATSRRQAPDFAQSGIKTKEHEVTLELKVIADVGIVGRPNAGKSTFLSVVTNAKPKIAAYPFTTLSPNLGVVTHNGETFVAADIPGLIEGAAQGAGLGYEFLRHVERTRILIHIIDASEFDEVSAVDSYRMITSELEEYSEGLSSIECLVALNKIEMVENPEKLKEEFCKETGVEDVFLISGVTHKGVDKLLDAVTARLKKIDRSVKVFESEHSYDELKDNTFSVEKLGAGCYTVVGGMIDNITRGVTVSNPDSLAYFQKALKNFGINDALKEAGVKEGDTVIVADIEFEFFD